MTEAPLSVEALQAGLAAPDAELRRQTLVQAHGTLSEPARSLIVRALGDADWRVRTEAVRVLGSKPLEAAIAHKLVDVLQHESDVGYRNAAVEALAGGGEMGVRALTQRVQELDADARKLAADALARTNTPLSFAPLALLAVDVDANVCAAALEAMALVAEQQPERVLPLLDSAIRRPELFVRLVALDTARRLGLVLPWSNLEPHLAEAELVLTALQIAAHLDDARAAPHFVRQMNMKTGLAWFSVVKAFRSYVETAPGNRQAALKALRNLSTEAVPVLLRAATLPDSGADALFVLSLHEPAAAGELLSSWLGLDEHWDTVSAAVDHLGVTAVQPLLQSLSESHERARGHALEHLLRLAQQDTLRPQIMPQLRLALQQPSPAFERLWLGALARWGDAVDYEQAFARLGKEKRVWLRRALSSVIESGARRFAQLTQQLLAGVDASSLDAGAAAIAMTALSDVGPALSTQHYEFLVRALANPDAFVRTHVLEALAVVAHERAAEDIAFAIMDDSPEVQLAAVRALGSLSAKGFAAARERLLNIGVNSANVSLAMTALQALAGSCDQQLLTQLAPALGHSDSWRAAAAVNVLRGYAPSVRWPTLQRALTHADAEVVKSAIELMETNEHTLDDLGRCLKHPAWTVRRAAADRLGSGGYAPASPLLSARLAEEKEPAVVEAIHRSLAELTAAHPATWSAKPPASESAR